MTQPHEHFRVFFLDVVCRSGESPSDLQAGINLQHFSESIGHYLPALAPAVSLEKLAI